jgi:hypothetical protein
MDFVDQIKKYYGDHVPGPVLEKNHLKAPWWFT